MLEYILAPRLGVVSKLQHYEVSLAFVALVIKEQKVYYTRDAMRGLQQKKHIGIYYYYYWNASDPKL